MAFYQISFSGTDKFPLVVNSTLVHVLFVMRFTIS